MARRVLIVPAAGRGSRLSASLPKLLVPVAGRPMIDHVLARYAGVVERAIVVVSPAAEDLVRAHFLEADEAELKFGATGGAGAQLKFGATGGAGATAGRALPVEIAVQREPTGMLEAILIPLSSVEAIAPDAVWITWCDQVGISDATVARLRDVTADGAADVALPTIQVSAPYVHLARDEGGRIVRVLQRREGDAMPETGETDGGLFALSAAAYLQHLPAFAAAGVASGAHTGERNFTPFIPWMGARGVVRTFPLQDPIEAVGINTPDELQRLEAHLEARRPSPPPAARPSDRP